MLLDLQHGRGKEAAKAWRKILVKATDGQRVAVVTVAVEVLVVGVVVVVAARG
jgi:hypothetical protein